MNSSVFLKKFERNLIHFKINAENSILMMNRISILKKLTVITAALILIYNTSGYIIVYQHLISMTRYNNHQAIEQKQVKEKIIILSFLKSDIEDKRIDFVWKHSREFKYNGSMYDIVERYDTEDSVHFYCFLDKKENKLKADFNKHFENNKGDKKNNSGGRTIPAPQVTDMFHSASSVIGQDSNRQEYFCSLESTYQNNDPDIPSPPPKNFLV